MCVLGRGKTLILQLKTEHMHYLCEALSCDSLMTNPQAELSLSSVAVRVVSGILFYFIVFCMFSALVTLLKILPLISRSSLSEPSPSD